MSTYLELFIDQGSTFKNEIVLSDQFGESINLSNVVISGQIRKTYSSINPTETFQIVTTDSANGTVTLLIPHANTANINPGRYVYDINMLDQNTNERIRLFEGIITITPQVTR